MKLSINRDELIKPLQLVQGVVERRHTLPILANILMRSNDNQIRFIATDMEVELDSTINTDSGESGEITVPARKFYEIVKALSPDSEIKLQSKDGQIRISSGRSRFNLSTLPAQDFPVAEGLANNTEIEIPAGKLKKLLARTQFAMAQQDVRYYLNGMLFSLSGKHLTLVSTDGHRLAVADIELDNVGGNDDIDVIVPRKAVIELGRILSDGDDLVQMRIGSQAIEIIMNDVCLRSKLVDGRFPDYQRVLPRIEDCSNVVKADRELLRQGLLRASILSNEKYRAVRIALTSGTISVLAHNPEQEQAEDELSVEYDGEDMEIGFNVTYMIDALSALDSDMIEIYLSDSSSSCLIQSPGDDSCQYVIMPMRL